MNKGLLVIDMQNICVGEEHAALFHYDNANLIKCVNERIQSYDNNMVFYIANMMKDNLINRFAPFKAFEGSTEVEFVKDLLCVSNNAVKKYRGDAFTNPALKQMLDERNITSLELVGVDGGGCVARTALGALNNGYDVEINTSAVGTIFTKREEKLHIKLKKKGAIFIKK